MQHALVNAQGVLRNATADRRHSLLRECQRNKRFDGTVMMKIGRRLFDFIDDESGPTFVEYGLLVIVIAMVVVAAASTLGVLTSSFFAVPTP